MKLGPGAEFDRIRRYAGGELPMRDDVRVGAGDDCAVVVGDRMAVTVDLTIEDVHFRRAWIGPEDVGHRAAIASLSDLAACAARPIGLLASLAVRPDDSTGYAEQVMHGLRRTGATYDAVLLGGDLSRSHGPLILDVVALGHVTHPVLRSGARPGDALWVTGRLGGAAAALHAWLAGRDPDPAAARAFARPVARIREALWLAERARPSSMIDLSDGLAGDAAHLAAASDVRIVLYMDHVPIHPAAGALPDPLRSALTGGEDYELCFTAPLETIEAVASDFERTFDLALHRVGGVSEGSGVMLRAASGELRPSDFAGFDHFARVPV